eukprot:4325898-Prymnesium_polylepis.2
MRSRRRSLQPDGLLIAEAAPVVLEEDPRHTAGCLPPHRNCCHSRSGPSARPGSRSTPRHQHQRPQTEGSPDGSIRRVAKGVAVAVGTDWEVG